MASLVVPSARPRATEARTPDWRCKMHDRRYGSFEELIKSCSMLPPLRTAVVYPCEKIALSGAAAAAAAGIIKPTLVGPETEIRALAASLGIDLGGTEVCDEQDSRMAAEYAAGLADRGRVDALMKGSLESAELMSPVVKKNSGLRTARRISHVFVIKAPAYSKLLLLTDGAINIAPTLEEKVDIVQNAIDLAHALGMLCPKVAILSAIEMVRPSIPSTIDAAALCKMADRGQITGAILDGPLAFDEAISREAAVKRIESAVAGDPDILLVPDLDAGNMLAKEVRLFAGAEEAGIVLGARVPIILTSRADNVHARIASCAIAALYARGPASVAG
ncbi:MAG: bifunctional enoyl-CoA hydratase/phosphate acetyltransferase [Deltaproteobacteria bacterium]|nr:bifunctional enoyl-CoA hydratase/phosphate acetyltransferase [Deltaproteobacteria bacterium]